MLRIGDRVTHISPSMAHGGQWSAFPAVVTQVNDGSVNLEITTADGRKVPAFGQTMATPRAQFGWAVWD